MKATRTGFTLIELLIVVAIIAILAAIAVPNFLEAQVRAKVSRVRTDMRSLATALETYKVDTNRYPPSGWDLVNWPDLDLGCTVYSALWRLSTPVAYITSSDSFASPFFDAIESYWVGYNANDGSYYYNRAETREVFDILWWGDPNSSSGNPVIVTVGLNSSTMWGLEDPGPDRFIGPATDQGSPYHVEVYDGTNGTISVGNIFRFGP